MTGGRKHENRDAFKIFGHVLFNIVFSSLRNAISLIRI